MMDLEPWRCRRTDGRKWRCYKSVLPNEKYCETHMHRGRKRSRKLVEMSSESACLNCHTPDFMNTNKRDNPRNDFRIKNPTILDHKPQRPPNQNPVSSDTSSVKDDNVAKEVSADLVISAPNFTTSRRIYKDDKKYNAGEFNDNVTQGVVIMNRSSGLDFSPDSVLHGALRHPRVEKCKVNLNTESERCRRTDGKRWRCSSKVVPHQKYCATHMNRGAKKPVTLMSTSGNSNYALGSAPGLNSNEPEETKLGLGLNTNLNIPYSSSSATNIEDDSTVGSGGSGSTTETTISDESIDVADMITLST